MECDSSQKDIERPIFNVSYQTWHSEEIISYLYEYSNILQYLLELQNDGNVISICAEDFDASKIPGIEAITKLKKEFVIVKYASDDYPCLGITKPRFTGAYEYESMHNTFAGITANIQPKYTSLVHAEHAIMRAEKANDCGYYAICFVRSE